LSSCLWDEEEEEEEGEEEEQEEERTSLSDPDARSGWLHDALVSFLSFRG